MCFMCGTPLIYSRKDLSSVQDHLEIVHDVEIEYSNLEERLLKLGLLGPLKEEDLHQVHHPSDYLHGRYGRILTLPNC